MHSINQSVHDLKGIAGALDFIELLLMAAVLIFFLYYGVNYMKRFKEKNFYDTERKMSLGFSLFFITMFLGYGNYFVDKIGRFFFSKSGSDGRVFLIDVDYGIVSAVSRDYLLLTLIEMGASFVFLSFVVERYVLSRKVMLTWTCAAVTAYTCILRILEVGIHPLSPDIAKNIGYIAYGGGAIVLVMLLGLLARIIKVSPSRTGLMKSSVLSFIGMLVLAGVLLLGKSAEIMLAQSASVLGINLVTPIIALASLFLLNAGLANTYKSLIDYFQSERICIVCRGKIAGKTFICPRCGVLYCVPCRDAVAEIDNKCWNCKTTLAPGKFDEPVAPPLPPPGPEPRPESGGEPEVAAEPSEKEPGKAPKR